jgi:hypothetical protein
MELLNRHHVMTEIMGRRGFADHARFALWEIFISIATARQSRRPLHALRHQFSGRTAAIADLIRRI